ncbi:eukaryotic translation initiation factor 3 subunit J [Melampsora americana]|nr:eukaryotic translation initiation factor 3 subunit J [Melampsora americana]
MSDWDASDNENQKTATPVIPITTTVKTNKWADEDADEDVKDDWEASEDSDNEKKPEPTKPKGPVRNKGITKMKIAEKEAEEASRLAELQAKAEEEADPILRKKREQQRTVEADMENARGLFGDAVISSGSEDPMKMNPKTKEDFEAMSTALAKVIISKHGSKALYPTFLEHFIRQLAAPVSDVHARKAASALTTIANEKQRIARDAKKGGKGGKVKPTLGGVVGTGASALKGGRGAMADLEVYDQALDDAYDDDFM